MLLDSMAERRRAPMRTSADAVPCASRCSRLVVAGSGVPYAVCADARSVPRYGRPSTRRRRSGGAGTRSPRPAAGLGNVRRAPPWRAGAKWRECRLHRCVRSDKVGVARQRFVAYAERPAGSHGHGGLRLLRVDTSRAVGELHSPRRFFPVGVDVPACPVVHKGRKGTAACIE